MVCTAAGLELVRGCHTDTWFRQQMQGASTGAVLATLTEGLLELHLQAATVKPMAEQYH